MRRSSSTTSRCGALSDSATAGPGMIPPVKASARLSRAAGAADEAQHALAAIVVDHRGEERARAFVRVRAELRERARDALGLQAGELHRELLAFRRDEKQPMAPIVGPLLLDDIALVDELLEHAAERLLGDAQDVEQVGHLHARVPVDEMQHPMMRPSKSEFLQNVVRI